VEEINLRAAALGLLAPAIWIILNRAVATRRVFGCCALVINFQHNTPNHSSRVQSPQQQATHIDTQQERRE
jgi:hypothetical protein